MKKRKKMTRRASKNNFTKGAKVKMKNMTPGAYRGGIRL